MCTIDFYYYEHTESRNAPVLKGLSVHCNIYAQVINMAACFVNLRCGFFCTFALPIYESR